MKDHLIEKTRFVMKTETVMADGIAKELPDYLAAHGWSRIGLVVDRGLFDSNEYARDIVEMLQQQLESVVLLISEMPEPTYDYLDREKAPFQACELDCFVGIGGGSTLDLTKGLATLTTNPGPAIEYRGFGKVKSVPLPVVALPSTAGTGSEVTPYAVFIDTAANWKFGINTEYNYPRLALYDPKLLDSCPDSVFASAGMDAMTHTLESFVARNATVVSRCFSRQAFKLLFPNLRKVAEGDRSTAVKLNLLLGSGCAGIALMNSGAGPAGALSYPLGVYFNVPHGLAGSVFLPKVIEYNVENGYDRYDELYDLIFEEPGLSACEKSVRFGREIKQLSDALGIPTALHGFGVKSQSDAKFIVDNSMQLKPAFEQNPVEFAEPQIERIVYALS